jgi:hypothetical protein
VTTKYFVPISEIRKLAEGSFEQTAVTLSQVVENSSKQIFGEDVVCELIGTFPDTALVLSENGDVARIRWSRNEQGNPQITGHEPVKVSRYSSENRGDYVRQEVRRAVRSWMEGRVDEAKGIIAEVAPYAVGAPSQDPSKVVEALAVELKAPRPWRVLLQSRSEQIRPMVGEAAIRKIEEEKVAPKYGPLYNGRLAESEILSYRDLVEGDFVYLTTRVGALKDLVESSYDAVRSVVRSEELKEEEAIKVFVTFSEDLIADLRRLQKIVSEATTQISKLDSLGKLHDTIVEHEADYAVASRFVEAMSSRLLEAMK